MAIKKTMTVKGGISLENAYNKIIHFGMVNKQVLVVKTGISKDKTESDNGNYADIKDYEVPMDILLQAVYNILKSNTEMGIDSTDI